MRWDNLKIEAEGSAEQARLPGYRDAAVIRRFDAPEALDMRFYEIQARSVINKVPEKSRMPFRHTINPYRGCSHACQYCTSPDTPVLLANGRHRRIADLRVGEAIYGTWRVGRYRRLVVTRVLDHWSSIKPAFRVTLEDETELITSGDHRFLTGRGWKHVIGAEAGLLQRPHLTLTSKMMGFGRFVDQPVPDADYRAGYLCGMVRGDGTIGTYRYPRGNRRGRVDAFRVALVDFEALRRTQAYLDMAGVSCREQVYHAATGAHRESRFIATRRRNDVEFIQWVIEWPENPSDAWCKGFLAGIFDAEGSCSRGVLRISNKDAEILGWIETCLRRFGFDVVVEPARANGLFGIRVRGGQVERMRFFHTTDPAITRKRSFAGEAIKNNARLRVVSIEPVEKSMRLYDITTGTGDFIANGVVSHNCFARPTHTYLGFNAGRDFEREIVVKVNAPEVVRAELARPSWKREHIAMGTNTDPYQWVEGRYKLMEGIWEALRDAANPCSILTKSPLLLRDLPLMKQIAEVTDISASLSVPTLDEKAWRATEPHTPHPRARLEAVAELNRAGIATGVLVAPLMPGINDAPEQLEPLLQMAHDAGAVGIGGIALHLRGEVKGLFMDWLRDHRPDLVDRYERLYARGAYAPPEERKRLAALISTRTGTGRPSRMQRLAQERQRETQQGTGRAPPRRKPVQEALF